MAINEQHRQLEIARELEEVARTLAHSTRTVPIPSQSYDLIAELRSTITLLGQVTGQLATWHAHTIIGTHYDGEDPVGQDRNGKIEAAAALKVAAATLDAVETTMSSAHTVNGRIRWYSDARPHLR